MKRSLAMIIVFVLLFSIAINAVQDVQLNQSDKIQLLKAYGINEIEASNMTELEISELFQTSEIKDFSLIPKMIDRKKMINDLEKQNRESIDILVEKGFTKVEAKKIIESGLNYYENQNLSKEDIQNKSDELVKMSTQDISTEMDSASTPYHQWYGTYPSTLLAGEMNCRFHGNAYPTSWRDGTINYYWGYLTQETHPYYDEKNMMLEFDSVSAMKAAYKLYNSNNSQIRGTYNMWGELPSAKQTDWKDTHKGIDFQAKRGTTGGDDLFSIFDLTGKVTYINKPTSKSKVSFLAVYYSSINVTVIYEHLDIDSSMVLGKSIYSSTKIGTESNYGAPQGTHTHIQLQSNKVDSFADIKTLVNSSTELNTIDPASYFTSYVPNI